jgi:hypothetical protein
MSSKSRRTTAKPKAQPAETEALFQAAVIELAQRCGWLAYHIPDSRRATSPGFPDLVLVRGSRLLFIELKTARGRVRPEQMVWLSALCAAGVRAFVARPKDWGVLEQELMQEQAA